MQPLTMGETEFRALARIAARLDFFTPLKGQELDTILSHIKLYGYRAGETIFQRGSPSDALYIIYEGQVRILMNRNWLWLIRRQARLEAGNLFGEMGLLEGRARSATAVASQPTKLFVLLQVDFEALMQRNPAFAEGMRWVASQRKFEDSH